jgi:poly-gamma-glutamate synthesis protein (capsule biosynthesis protein)
VDNENLRFEVGADPGVYRQVDDRDVDAITAEVHRASRQADWTVASLHAHESADGRSLDHSTPGFVEEFARACIDAGADAFVGHGAHVLQGIEVYEGAPIFYDLGNCFIMNQLVERLPAELYERYGLGPDANPVDVFDGRIYDEEGNPRGFLADPGGWESGLTVCTWRAGALESVELHPLGLRVEEPRPRRGRAVVAGGERAREILENLRGYADPYGTEIEIDDGVGRIVLD